MEGEQFSLCWNNFYSNLSSGFNTLLKDEDLVDVTLAAGGRFLKAHKTVLSICSPFFMELFRATPSKHPIVILPEVNFDALCNLLQFMYQGEVSVKQEEIPTFMRVAEMLKVKGLTDNSSSSSTSTEPNGYTAANKSTLHIPETRPIMKRTRPTKKIIKPIQPLRPLESLEPPQPKRAHTNNESPLNCKISQQDYPEALVKPKEEPKSKDSDLDEETSLDLSTFVDTKLGESTSWSTSDFAKPLDATPGRSSLILMKSGRGQLVLIHNGHIYTLCDKQNDQHIWICVKKKTLNCSGCLTTANGPILLSCTGHNHPPLQDVIKRLQTQNCNISPELLQ